MDVITKQRAYSLIKIIQKKQIDITVGRAVWKSIGQALASEFGPEEGLRLFHLVSKWHPDYDPTECNEMFDWCIKNHDDVDIATFFYHCQKSENPEGQHNILFADSDTMHEVLLSFHIAAHG